MEFTRGDSHGFCFQRKDFNGELIKSKSEKMWFTVKKNYKTTEILIQKTLENGEITYTDDDFTYHIMINPNDTKKLNYGDYVYDIQIENAGIVKTIAKDTLTLTEEVTFEGGEQNE